MDKDQVLLPNIYRVLRDTLKVVQRSEMDILNRLEIDGLSRAKSLLVTIPCEVES